MNEIFYQLFPLWHVVLCVSGGAAHSKALNLIMQVSSGGVGLVTRSWGINKGASVNQNILDPLGVRQLVMPMMSKSIQQMDTEPARQQTVPGTEAYKPATAPATTAATPGNFSAARRALLASSKDQNTGPSFT